MIPSLLVSVAGAMVATRASSESSLGEDLTRQLFPRSSPLWIVSRRDGHTRAHSGLAENPFFPHVGFVWLVGTPRPAGE